jgi:hypothetical protein
LAFPEVESAIPPWISSSCMAPAAWIGRPWRERAAGWGCNSLGMGSSATLRQHFDRTPLSERILRNWTKKTGFGRSVSMSREDVIKGEDLVELVDEAARQISGEILS